MSESHRVKFRSGRDPNDSEARSSAGVPQYDANAGRYYRPRHWDVDSVHQKIGFLTRGLQKSDSNFKIYDLLADADGVIDVIVSYCGKSEIIWKDVDRLNTVLSERHSRFMQGSTYESRFWLKDLSRRLGRVAASHPRVDPDKTAQHGSPQTASAGPVKSLHTRTATFGR